MFENQPKALYALALANTGERFGYYTMLAVFALFLRANFGLEAGTAGLIYSIFLGLVYFLPLIGGFMADKFGYGKMVTIGIAIMFVGYLFLSIPLGGGSIAFIAMLAALLLISFGTGLFKGNLQVMVGNLYDTPELAGKRDSAFSIFYMAINIGALFAPTAAVKIQSWAEATLHCSSNDAYHFSFAVACVSLIVSMAIYYGCRRMFKHVEGGNGKTEKKDTTVAEEELTPQQTKERIVALCLVFAVVIFFWMAFHQNGLTLTYFANEFVSPVSTGVQSMAFDVVNLVMIVLMVYSGMTFFQSKTAKAKAISGVVFLVAVLVLMWKYRELSGSVEVSAPIFQQFNPFYVVALTPVSMAISQGLLTPNEQAAAKAAGGETPFASANWLIGTYLVLTFGELLLSPMGISFVSKVAPPKYKGAMMGGWFVATAIGNLLVSVGGYLWGGLSLTIVWSVFIVLCLISAAFMFLMMKRLEKVA